MIRLIIFLVTTLTMISCESFYKDNGCIQMYEGNTEASYTVYFYSDGAMWDWDDVYVFSWDSDSSENNGGWPGEKMTYDGNGWCRATVSYPNVIFSNYDGEQTTNLTIEKSNPFCYPSIVDTAYNNIYCEWRSSRHYNISLPTYTYYFYNGNLDWSFVYIKNTVTEYFKIIRKEMTYDGDGWYYAETIYPSVSFHRDYSYNNECTVFVGGNSNSTKYIVPDESYVYDDYIPVSEYDYMPNL